MKHKVKEIFDNREEYRRWEDDIQELFNCQLTWEQSGVLYLMVCGMCDKAKNNDDLEAVRELEKIKSKLLKQNEMWVSDDETN